jgi:SAM-dependent methyltransferase
MLQKARELAAADGIDNVRFEQADAQTHPFEAGQFDVVLSRFGSMFFADPIAAFTNVHRATRSSGRLVIATWRPFEENEWGQAIFASLAAGRELPTPQTSAPGPFGLADRDFIRTTLSSAGYRDIDVVPIESAAWWGADVEDAMHFIGGLGVVRGLSQGLDANAGELAMTTLRDTIAAHAGADGVRFASAAWLTSARI